MIVSPSLLEKTQAAALNVSSCEGNMELNAEKFLLLSSSYGKHLLSECPHFIVGPPGPAVHGLVPDIPVEACISIDISRVAEGLGSLDMDIATNHEENGCGFRL